MTFCECSSCSIIFSCIEFDVSSTSTTEMKHFIKLYISSSTTNSPQYLNMNELHVILSSNVIPSNNPSQFNLCIEEMLLLDTNLTSVPLFIMIVFGEKVKSSTNITTVLSDPYRLILDNFVLLSFEGKV